MDFSSINGLSVEKLQTLYDDVVVSGSNDYLVYEKNVHLKITCNDNKVGFVFAYADRPAFTVPGTCLNASNFFFQEKINICGYNYNATACALEEGNVNLKITCNDGTTVGFVPGYADRAIFTVPGTCLGGNFFFEAKQEVCGYQYGTACAE